MFFDDGVFPRPKLVEVDRRFIERDAERVGVLRFVEHLCRVQQRFRWNAADERAYAARVRLRVDQGNLHAHIRGMKRRGIPARAGTNDGDSGAHSIEDFGIGDWRIDCGFDDCLIEDLLMIEVFETIEAARKTKRAPVRNKSSIFNRAFNNQSLNLQSQNLQFGHIHQSGLLDRFRHPAQEPHAVGAVDDAVIVGERERHHQLRGSGWPAAEFDGAGQYRGSALHRGA